jgi:hypothetical protein
MLNKYQAVRKKTFHIKVIFLFIAFGMFVADKLQRLIRKKSEGEKLK